MIFTMRSIIRKQHKVLNMVIRNNLINVMDNFFFVEISSKMFLHYKAVFKYISRFVARGMFWGIYACITKGMKNLATFPVRMLVSTYITNSMPTLTRTIFCTVLFNTTCICEKFFSTYKTFNCLHSVLGLTITFFTAIFSFSFFNPIGISKKLFATNKAFLNNTSSAKFAITFFRTIFSFVSFQCRRICFKLFSTIYTVFLYRCFNNLSFFISNHITSQIKKPLSVCLEVTAKLLTRTKGLFLSIKKLSLLSSVIINDCSLMSTVFYR